MILLLSIVTIQSLITALLIYLNKKFRDEDFYLSLFFGVFFLHLTYKIALVLLFNNEIVFEKLHGGFSFLYTPIIYFYTLSIFGNKISKKQMLIHFSPFFIGILCNFFLMCFLLGDNNFNKIIQFYNLITMSLFAVSFFGYSFYSLKFIKKFQHQNDTIVSLKMNIVKVTSYLHIALSLIIIVSILFVLIDYKNPINMRYVYYVLLLIMFFVVIHIRFGIFFETQKKVKEDFKNEYKYKNYELNLTEMDEIIEKINFYFNKRKMHLDSEFSIDTLSADIKIPKIKITQSLSIRLDTNFYKFLNRKRVEESKRLIDKTKDYNFASIGYQSGFKNKSTFYKYFKQTTGLTPSEYKKEKTLIF
jgi:AraC-like DNA-binding protein